MTCIILMNYYYGYNPSMQEYMQYLFTYVNLYLLVFLAPLCHLAAELFKCRLVRRRRRRRRQL